MNKLVSLAAAAGELPTLEQVDAMLEELRRMPRDQKVIELIDDLLEFRALACGVS
jgi:hypothetical protein